MTKIAKKKTPRAKKPEPRKINLTDAVGEAFGELECLAEEMRDWAGNIEEKFSSTQKYEDVSTAADSLENIQQPDIDDTLGEIEITIQDPTPSRKPRSRATRCGDACNILSNCISALEEFASFDSADTDEAKVELADDLRGELENVMSEAESVEFPGMFG